MNAARRYTIRPRALVAGLLAMATLSPGLGGCAAVVVVAYANGELKRDLAAPMDRAWEASREAVRDTGLEVSSEVRGPSSGRILAKTPGGDDVTLRLDARGEDLTRARVRVSLFGDEKRSREILGAIESRLGLAPEAGVPAE